MYGFVRSLPKVDMKFNWALENDPMVYRVLRSHEAADMVMSVP
jgi:hypothetical protein